MTHAALVQLWVQANEYEARKFTQYRVPQAGVEQDECLDAMSNLGQRRDQEVMNGRKWHTL